MTDRGYTETINDICADLAAGPKSDLRIHSVHSRLDKMSESAPENLELRALSEACAYRMLEKGQDSSFALSCYAPMLVVPQPEGMQTYPAMLTGIADDVLEVWRQYATDEHLHPIVRARLADLLWVRRYDAPGRWFQTAISAYVALASTPADSLDRVVGLSRAVSICTEANHPQLLTAPLNALQDLCGQLLDASENEYGVLLRALRALVDSGHSCDGLVKRSIQRSCDDPFQLLSLYELAVDVSEDEAKVEHINLKRIQTLLELAKQLDGLTGLTHLETARSIAHQAQLHDEEKRIALLIEQQDLQGEFSRFDTTVEVDLESMRSSAEDVVGDDDLSAALHRFGYVIPTGDPDATASFVERMMREYPLQFLFPVIRVGPENSVTHIPGDHPARRALEIGEHDARSITLFSHYLGRMSLMDWVASTGPTLSCFRSALPATRFRMRSRGASAYRLFTGRMATMSVRSQCSFSPWRVRYVGYVST